MYRTRKTISCLLLAAACPLFVCAQATVLNECTRALYREDYSQVERLAQGHLQKKPTDVSVRVVLARAELAEGKFGLAFEDLRKTLASNPHNVDALYYLSFAARAMSQQEYQHLFAMAPDSSRVHQLLAESALESQDPAQAEAEFRKALDANPRSVELATELAELKRSQSKFDEAIAYYSQVVQLQHDSYAAAYGLGACYTYKQDYKQAVDWLRKAVELAPDSAAGHFALGNALFQSGSLESAIPELKISLRLEPGMKQAYFLLGRAYTKLGRKEEAAKAFEKLDEPSVPAEQSQSSRPR